MLTDAWVKASGHVANSLLEANRAALAAFAAPPTASHTGVDAVAHTRPDWSSERSVTAADAITVGDTVRFSKRFTDDDVAAFAEASGDTNRLHLEDAYAAQTRFGDRIVHGTLVAGLVSAALARLPGLTIYLAQDMEFHAPVPIDARVTATVEIVEAIGEDRYRLTTEVADADTTYLTGEATVLIDDRPAPTPADA